MGVNVSALTAFALSWLFRDRGSWEPGVGTFLLELAGVGLVTYGGWLGGTLVYRNQIGVDHRYAHAGKWHEQTVEGSPGPAVAVARADELKPGQMKLLHVGGRRIVLARTDEGHVAFADRCTHRGGPLADGVLACGVVTCPWHGSQFDVRSGGVRSGPAGQPTPTYRVEESGGEVRLTLP
jgi:nitrite reductase/ring-hydroxylating ferredoxin subunit